MAKGPTKRAGNHSKLAHNYSIVDGLAQSLIAMSALEVLQSCPKQMKALISMLGAIDPGDTRLMDFDLDKAMSRLPSMVAFQILVSVHNITTHRCVIYDDASTCIMSKNVWQKLWSPEIKPSVITLRAYDGRPSTPVDIYQNVLIYLARKTVLIEIEVLDAHLDYNILLG